MALDLNTRAATICKINNLKSYVLGHLFVFFHRGFVFVSAESTLGHF